MREPGPSSNRCRIVLTGGPGGGKTTAADLFRREIGDRVVIVPEAATILFQGGFPRSRAPQASRFAQTAIFHVQRHLEDVQAALFPGRTLLCDRGTVDGAVYWPGQPHDYFRAVGTTLDTELARYDAVIFLRTKLLLLAVVVAVVVGFTEAIAQPKHRFQARAIEPTNEIVLSGAHLLVTGRLKPEQPTAS
jgi:hypothetical protein